MAVTEFRLALLSANLSAKVVFSGGDDVDVIPTGAGKGKALEFVLSRLPTAQPHHGVQACLFQNSGEANIPLIAVKLIYHSFIHSYTYKFKM